MKLVNTSTKTYATFFFAGSFFSEESRIEVDNREVESLEIPKGCFAVQFHDIKTAEIDINGTMVKAYSDPVNKSGKVYIDADVLNRAEVAEKEGENAIVVRNMEGSGWSQVVLCRTGNYQPFLEGDRVVNL